MDAMRRNCVTPTMCQVFGTDYREEIMDNKEAKARLMQSSKGELADRLLFAYATIQRLESKLEGAKNTEQANQPDSSES